jgi:hypothetical protein
LYDDSRATDINDHGWFAYEGVTVTRKNKKVTIEIPNVSLSTPTLGSLEIADHSAGADAFLGQTNDSGDFSYKDRDSRWNLYRFDEDRSHDVYELLDDVAKSELNTLGVYFSYLNDVNDSDVPVGDNTFDHVTGSVTIHFDTYNIIKPFILTPVELP